MNIYGLLEDLKIKLDTYLLPQDNVGYGNGYGVESREADIELICAALSKSALSYKKLTREVVADLLEGKIGWPRCGGSYKVLNSGVTLEELERHFAVRFVRGEIQVVGLIRPKNGLGKHGRKLMRALNYLYNIRWGEKRLQRNRLVIGHEALLDVLDSRPGNRRFADLGFLEPCGAGGYTFLLSDLLVKPIGSALWPLLLREQTSGKEALVRWLDIMSHAFDHPHVFKLEFESWEHEDSFLDAGTELLLEESDLHCSWADEHRKLRAERNRGLSLVQNADVLYYETPGSEPDSLLSAYTWWHNEEYQYGGYSEFRLLYYGLLNFLVKKDRKLFHLLDSDRIGKLLNECLRMPGLAGAMLNMNCAPTLTCFFLRREDAVVVAMLHVAADSNLPNRNIASLRDHQELWRSLIWQQSLEAFFSHFELLHEESRKQTAGSAVTSLVHALGVAAFSPSHGVRINDGKARLKEALVYFEQAVCKEYSNAPTRNLLQTILPFFANAVIERLPAVGATVPIPEWYLLFWSLEKSRSLRYELTTDSSGNTMLMATIASAIQQSYLRLLDAMVHGNDPTSGHGADATVDQLDWSLLYEVLDTSQRTMLINTLDVRNLLADREAGNEGEANRSQVAAIRLHARVITSIYVSFKDHGAMDAILMAQDLVKLCLHFGFGSNAAFAAFGAIYEDEWVFGGIGIWKYVAAASNQFRDETFDMFLRSIFDASPPLKSVLQLYEETVSAKRREMIMDHLKSLEPAKLKFVTLTEVRDDVLLAANANLPDLADQLLFIGKPKEGHRLFAEWRALEYQISLQKIYSDTALSMDERSRLMWAHPLPEEVNSAEGIFKDLKLELMRYQRFLQALLLFDLQPRKCYDILDALCSEALSPLYVSNRLAARLKVVETDGHGDKAEAYRTALNEWKSQQSKFPQHKLNLHEYRLLLTCHAAIGDAESFEQLWEAIPVYQQAAQDLVSVRCHYLQKSEKSGEALRYLKWVRSVHSVLTDELSQLLHDLETELTAGDKISRDEARIYRVLDNGRLPLEKAREYWLEIQKLSDRDHALLFSRTRSEGFEVERFILENVVSVCNELLLRTKNLQRQVNNRKALAPSIEEEDIITDWFTSMFEQRMSYLSWRVGDQKLGGESESGQRPGRADGWICNSYNDRLFLFEAFRLPDKNIKAPIHSHLNKVGRYDSIGCSPVVVAAYCAVKEFEELSRAYLKHVSNMQYDKFDHQDLSSGDQRFTTVPWTPANLKIFQEVRLRHGKEIVFFHVLLSFGW